MRRTTRAARTELPSGTVTFLLTDVEASSAHWDNDAESTDGRLQRLDDLLDACVGANGGRLLKSRGEGDSAFAVFDRASGAVIAAAAIQRTLRETDGLPVRAAIHTGEARLRDGDYYGVVPNRAARLRSLAHGGQVVVSRVSADLAEPELPPEISLSSLGTYRIRDWPRATQLFGVRAPGVRTEFPPLSVLGDAHQAVMTIVYVDAIGTHAAIGGLSDPQLIDSHRYLASTIRGAFDANRGTFLKMMGDGCLAAFEHPGAAVAFAVDVTRTTNIDLKIAAQTGIVELVGDDIIGRATFGAYKLLEHANPCELVTTAGTVELLSGQGSMFEPLASADDGTQLFALRLAAGD
jgi:class 3 adenylate cyclase